MNPLPGKNILIVDDERSIREALSEALEMSGYKTTAVHSGAAALDVLKGPEKPSLILLDLLMPEMDGLEFMRAKELISEIGSIPTVVISANGSVDAKLAGFNFQGYLKKPVDLSDLLETAERYCG